MTVTGNRHGRSRQTERMVCNASMKHVLLCTILQLTNQLVNEYLIPPCIFLRFAVDNAKSSVLSTASARFGARTRSTSSPSTPPRTARSAAHSSSLVAGGLLPGSLHQLQNWINLLIAFPLSSAVYTRVLCVLIRAEVLTSPSFFLQRFTDSPLMHSTDTSTTFLRSWLPFSGACRLCSPTPFRISIHST
jgi:hypothetical protein